MRASYAILAGAMLLIVAFPAANAQGASAGASGECFDDGNGEEAGLITQVAGPGTYPGSVTGGDGDDAEVRAGDDTNTAGNAVEVDSLTGIGATFGVVQLSEGQLWEGDPAPSNACDGGDTQGGTGWLEVHAGDKGTTLFVQVCWDGSTGNLVSVGGSGSCSTSSGTADGLGVGT